MLQPITLTTALILSLSLASVAVGQPQSTTRPPKPATTGSVIPEPDSACYYRSADGRVQDLGRLCNRQKKPAIVQTTRNDQVKLCYGPDNEYFPCPDELPSR